MCILPKTSRISRFHIKSRESPHGYQKSPDHPRLVYPLIGQGYTGIYWLCKLLQEVYQRILKTDLATHTINKKEWALVMVYVMLDSIWLLKIGVYLCPYLSWLGEMAKLLFIFLFFSFLFLELTIQKGVQESIMLQVSHSHSHMMSHMISAGK